MLQQTTRRDSASARQIDFHAMLATSGNRWRCDKDVKVRKPKKHIVAGFKLLWHGLIANMNPVIPGDRAKGSAVASDLTKGERFLLVHGYTMQDHYRQCKHSVCDRCDAYHYFIVCKIRASRGAGTLFA